MYKSFYNLTRNPFDLTPDPTCFVPTVRHNEALAALYYGIRRHKGVVVVTGEVGTGKTLLLRCLLKLFNQNSEIAYAYLFNCRMSAIEFLQYTVADFGIASAAEMNKSSLVMELSKYVTSRGLKGLTTVLIVDEAHNLSLELLEEIRLLSNLETNDDKLLQIVLVGQPELDEKLDSFQLRPLKQRIALRAHLASLNLEETERYITERLRVAGANGNLNSLFPPETVKAVHRYSRGYPRLVNTICENALITGYARQMESVGPEIVRQVAEDFRLDLDANQLTKRIQGQTLDELESSKGMFLDLNKARGSQVDELELTSPLAVKAGDYEPNI